MCIIRAEEGGKIKEYTYQKKHAAEQRVAKLLNDGTTFTVVDCESIHHLSTHDDLTIEQYLEDADCPELCNNDSFTLISPDDTEPVQTHLF